MSRSPQAVQGEMLALAPPGAGFPRRPDTNWGAMLLPQAKEIARWEGEAEQLHGEIDPRRAYYLLPEWEALFGSDPYGVNTSGFSTAQMQAYLYQRLTNKGGQSRGFYISLAAALGVAISITEYRQTVYGRARYGADRYINSPQQFYWTVTLPETQVTRARYGSARYGDRYGSFVPNPIVPMFSVIEPAHTQVIFSYTG